MQLASGNTGSWKEALFTMNSRCHMAYWLRILSMWHLQALWDSFSAFFFWSNPMSRYMAQSTKKVIYNCWPQFLFLRLPIITRSNAWGLYHVLFGYEAGRDLCTSNDIEFLGSVFRAGWLLADLHGLKGRPVCCLGFCCLADVRFIAVGIKLFYRIRR